MTQGMYIVVISANGVDVGTYKVAVKEFFLELIFQNPFVH
jgi:hypothetical protein